MDPSHCLLCTQAIATRQPCCPALQLAGVAAHTACCSGCSTTSHGIAGGAAAERPGTAT